MKPVSSYTLKLFSVLFCHFIELVFSCIAIFVLAALYEGLKVLREVLKRRYSYVVSVDFTETKVYGTGPNQTAVVTESKGELPRYILYVSNLLP